MPVFLFPVQLAVCLAADNGCSCVSSSRVAEIQVEATCLIRTLLTPDRPSRSNSLAGGVTFIRRTGQDSRATSLGNMSIRLCGYNVTSEECTVIWKPCPRRTSRQGGIYHFHLYNKRTLPSNFLATFFFSSVTLPRVLAKPSADARSDVWVKNICGPSSMRAGSIPFLPLSRKP